MGLLDRLDAARASKEASDAQKKIEAEQTSETGESSREGQRGELEAKQEQLQAELQEVSAEAAEAQTAIDRANDFVMESGDELSDDLKEEIDSIKREATTALSKLESTQQALAELADQIAAFEATQTQDLSEEVEAGAMSETLEESEQDLDAPSDEQETDLDDQTEVLETGETTEDAKFLEQKDKLNEWIAGIYAMNPEQKISDIKQMPPSRLKDTEISNLNNALNNDIVPLTRDTLGRADYTEKLRAVIGQDEKLQQLMRDARMLEVNNLAKGEKGDALLRAEYSEAIASPETDFELIQTLIDNPSVPDTSKIQIINEMVDFLKVTGKADDAEQVRQAMDERSA